RWRRREGGYLALNARWKVVPQRHRRFDQGSDSQSSARRVLGIVARNRWRFRFTCWTPGGARRGQEDISLRRAPQAHRKPDGCAQNGCSPGGYIFGQLDRRFWTSPSQVQLVAGYGQRLAHEKGRPENCPGAAL